MPKGWPVTAPAFDAEEHESHSRKAAYEFEFSHSHRPPQGNNIISRGRNPITGDFHGYPIPGQMVFVDKLDATTSPQHSRNQDGARIAQWPELMMIVNFARAGHPQGKFDQ